MKKYEEAENILGEIKKATKILLALHRNPDPDSVGSNLAVYHALHGLGKKDVTIISEDKPPLSLNFIPGIEKVKVVDMSTFDFSPFQLFIALDMGELGMIASTPGIPRISGMPIIAIDHHYTNTLYGEINLVDNNIGSTGELLYNLFKQWEIKIDKAIAIPLFTAIAGDTGVFRYASGVTPETLKIAGLLLEAGASLAEITFNFYQRNTPQILHFWGKVLEKIEIMERGKYKFAWATLTFEEFEKLGSSNTRDSAASMFFQGIEGTDFGLLMVEETKGVVKGSLRARNEADVSAIARALGGGGHKVAAGFTQRGDFAEIVSKVFKVIERI